MATPFLNGARSELKVFKDSSGVPIRLDAIANEISNTTGRQNLDVDLHESKARYRAILQALPDLLLLLNPDGTCVQCILPSTYDKSKYIPIKHHISEVLSSETLAAQLTLYEKAIATGEVQIYEHQLTKFGKTVYEEVRIAPYCDDELLVIVRDVTDRQIIKQQLQTLTDRLTLALKSAAIGIWEWDIVNNSLFWDERTYELYGVNPDPSTDAYLDWASRIHPSDRPFAEAAVQKAPKWGAGL